MTVTRLHGAIFREPVLRVNGLTVETSSGETIVEGVSLDLDAGEVFGIVGESGSGKTTTAMALLGAMSAGAVVTAGEIVIGGETIDANDEKAARRHRGRTVSYVPQNAGGSLNPSMRIGQIVAEMLRAHRPTVVVDTKSWSVLASAVLLGCLIISVNLIADAYWQAVGSSILVRRRRGPLPDLTHEDPRLAVESPATPE
jgi:ABC-type dipeptide/oligopeptide/nickel transport system ATPase component